MSDAPKFDADVLVIGAGLASVLKGLGFRASFKKGLGFKTSESIAILPGTYGTLGDFKAVVSRGSSILALCLSMALSWVICLRDVCWLVVGMS